MISEITRLGLCFVPRRDYELKSANNGLQFNDVDVTIFSVASSDFQSLGILHFAERNTMKLH